ncbi:MAG TPA: hypothetical protein VK183_11230, partial [Flavobacterium sp.]|nr:hypothetical protein [Flavobacterium sp.]
MKRLLLLLTVFAGATVFQSCEGERGPAGPAGPDSLVYELFNVDFTLSNGEYVINRQWVDLIGGDLYDEETVLIYRLTDTFNSNGETVPVWQLIPRTLFLEEGELDYDFDFSKKDFFIYAGGTFDVATTPEFINDQTFRIVVIPGYFANRRAVDYNDYNAVMQFYGIDDSNVKRIN